MINCPVCNSRDTELLITRKNVPVQQNIIIKNQNDAVNVTRGDINLHFCNHCSLVFNSSFDASKVNYNDSYDNNQTCSHSFQNYINELIEYLLNTAHINNATIVEIGTGNGKFLTELVNKGVNNKGIGFDPAYIDNSNHKNGNLKIFKEKFDPLLLTKTVDAFICRHTIEHIANPKEFLTSIAFSLEKSPEAKTFFETPSFEWILKNKVVWDIFYEHSLYFNKYSLEFAFTQAGLDVEKINFIFDDQYLWVEAKKHQATNHHNNLKNNNLDEFRNHLDAYISMESQLINKLPASMKKLAGNKKVALIGAAGKGVTFANLVDPEREWINCVADLNPRKHGHFLPGTGHEIVDYNDLQNIGVNLAIVLNPKYVNENITWFKNANIDMQIVDLTQLLQSGL